MSYEENGYVVIKNFFKSENLKKLHSILLKFHESWKKENFEFYSSKAINSAYLTGTKHLDNQSRQMLFKFIGSHRLMDVLSSIISEKPMFMNTQLFFNPINANQKNYWHRDPQYHLSVEEQKEALKGPSVVHFRIPLMDEPGIELIPGSHKEWDTEEELEVRLERNGRKNYEDMSSGVKISLEVGDLLIFSANMIHRGIYGMDRLALDILFCDSVAELAQFVEKDCLPSSEELSIIDNPAAFINALTFKS